MWVFKLHYYADIVAVVVCDKTCDTGREGVLRTTTKHTKKHGDGMAGGWASTIDCPQRHSEHWRASIDNPVACFMHDGRFW
jgi:hypothetical protein